MSDQNDIHGYIRFVRLLAWPAALLFIAVVLTIGVILATRSTP